MHTLNRSRISVAGRKSQIKFQNYSALSQTRIEKEPVCNGVLKSVRKVSYHSSVERL
jgi:hypothetical protein